MKNIFIKLASIAFVLFVVLLTTSQAFPPFQQYATQGTQVSVGFGMGDMNRVTMLTHMLSLTATQQAQAKAIFDEEDTVLKPLAEQFKQASDDLASAEKAAAPDAQIDQLAGNMANLSSEILSIDAKAQSKIYSQLTTDQKQKLEQLPHPSFVPSAPLLPSGPVFVSTSAPHGQN